MERAIQRLVSIQELKYEVKDRRHLSIRSLLADDKLRERVRKIVRISHGYVEEDKDL